MKHVQKLLPFKVEDSHGPLPAVPAPCILITHAMVLDDADAWAGIGKVFSVLFVDRDTSQTALWRGHSYDDAIRASVDAMGSHGRVFDLAEFGIVDHVVRRPV